MTLLKPSVESWLFALVALLSFMAVSCSGGGDKTGPATGGDPRKEVNLVAKTSIVDPVLSIDVQGDFVGPDRDAFANHVIFGDITVDEGVVRIGGKAWVRNGESEWQNTAIDDKDLKDSLDMSPGQLQFWNDYDPSDLAGFSGPREKFNGVDAIRISFTREDAQLLAKLFHSN